MANKLNNIKFEKETEDNQSIQKKNLLKKLTDEKLNRYIKFASAIALTLIVIYLFSMVAGEYLSGVLSTLGMIASAFIIAYILSILLEPGLIILEKLGIKSNNARASIVTLIFLLIIGLIIFVVIIPAVKSLVANSSNVDIVNTIKNTYSRFLDIMPAWMSSYLETYTADIGDTVARIDFEEVLPFMTKTLGGIVKIVLTLVYTFLFLFFMLKERDRLISSFENVLPKKLRRHYKNFTMTSENVFRQYVKGHFTVIFSTFLIALITFLIMGAVTGYANLVKYAFLFAIIIGLFDLIPYIGPWIGGVIVIAISAFLLGSFNIILAITIAVFAFQMVENLALQPIIMGNSLEVHPLGILTAMIIFASLGIGIIGIILAAPITSIIKILFRYIKAELQEKKLRDEMLLEQDIKG